MGKVANLLMRQISKEDCHNAIRQDVHNGKPRELADIPPFHGYPCNYGALPQVNFLFSSNRASTIVARSNEDRLGKTLTRLTPRLEFPETMIH